MANYYETDDILAEEELVPSVFQHNANGVGLFDSSDDTDKVLVPMVVANGAGGGWFQSGTALLAESKTREEIAADAAHVDLRNRCPYFYELGCKLAPLMSSVPDLLYLDRLKLPDDLYLERFKEQKGLAKEPFFRKSQNF
ncbi:hypothetical protein OROHE_013963 [Orobanche hederae]